LNEHTYLTELMTDGRKITSIIVGAITKWNYYLANLN
jgi:hypothetical protein